MGDQEGNAGGLPHEPPRRQLSLTFNPDQLQSGNHPPGTDSCVYLEEDFFRYLKGNRTDRLPSVIFKMSEDWIQNFQTLLTLDTTLGASNNKSMLQLRKTAEKGEVIRSLRFNFTANFGDHPLQKEQANIANGLIQTIIKECGKQCLQTLITSRTALQAAIQIYDPQKQAIDYASASWIKMCGGTGSKNNLDATYQVRTPDGCLTLSNALFRRAWKIAKDRAQVAMINRERQLMERKNKEEAKRLLRTAAQEAVGNHPPDDALKELRNLMKQMNQRLSRIELEQAKA